MIAKEKNSSITYVLSSPSGSCI